MEIFALKFQEFSQLFARMLAMLMVAPFYAGETMSFFYRLALAFLISLIVTPVIKMPSEFYTLVQNRYFTLLLEQVFTGIFIGVSLQILFGAFQMAGEFFSVQMGFGISEVFDPLSQISLPLMGTLKNMIALFVFFISGAHLWLIQSVVFSFEKFPIFSGNFLTNGTQQAGLLKFLVTLSSGMFLIALKIALPVMGTLLLVSLTLGLLSKAAPQMNILMLGFPLKILVSFIVLAWTAPIIIETMKEQFDLFFSHLDFVIRKWH